MRRISLILFPLLTLFLLAGSALAGPPADIVLHHGKIFTADAGRPWAQAVAIRGSRIIAVGNNGPVQALAGPGTRSIDLGGRVVVPGFNDSHSHLGVGLPRLTLPPVNIPGPGPTLQEAVDQVSQAVAVAQPGEWILVFVGEAVILDPAATRQVLDPVSPNNPVILLTWSSHSAVAEMPAAAIARVLITALWEDQVSRMTGLSGATGSITCRVAAGSRITASPTNTRIHSPGCATATA